MYIFGYGSLINRHSRQLTGQTGEAVPVVVDGLHRRWGKVDGSYRIAPLVCEPGDGRCNGVLVRVHDGFLPEFDRREKGYRRMPLDPDAVRPERNVALTEEPIWVYVHENPAPPCSVQPIMQTYVDTVLAGCLSISEPFARAFVETTLGWHHPFENDRHEPKYGNLAGVEAGHLSLIDRLVADVRP